MGQHYARTMFSEAAKRLQTQHGSRAQYERQAERGEIDDALSDFEVDFIVRRDSFYLATVTPDGWPYMQHRGGPEGFLRVLDRRTLAFADFAGNKQYISAGNLAGNDRVALFLMDYPQQARLKLIGHARIVTCDTELEERLRSPGYPARVERAVVITLTAYDWNCSQHITRRWTGEEIKQAAAAPHAAAG